MAKKAAEPVVAQKPAAPPSPPDVGGPVPRVVHERYRVPTGAAVKRFKVRCDDGRIPHPSLYVLANDEAEARQHYATLQRLDAATANLVVVAMPD